MSSEAAAPRRPSSKFLLEELDARALTTESDAHGDPLEETSEVADELSLQEHELEAGLSDVRPSNPHAGVVVVSKKGEEES